jgi:hypothetical protein
MIERMGFHVQLMTLDTPDDLISLLGDGRLPTDILIIAGPGDGNGFLFGSYELGSPGAMMQDDSIGVVNLAGKVALDGQLVISTAQRSGCRDMANAILDGGAAAYLAPEDWPSAADVLLFVHVMLHETLVRKRNITTAMEHAHGYADAFTLYLK